MESRKFTIGEAVGFGWSAAKQNLGVFILIAIVLFVLFGVLNVAADLLSERSPVLSLAVALLSVVLNLLVQLGLVKVALKCCDNVRPAVGDVFNCVPLLVKYFVGTILYSLIILGGLVLLIVPGIVWAVKYQFYPYFILEKGLGPVASIKMSGKMTCGAKWRLLFFDLVCMGVILLGVLAFLVGLIVAVPVVMVGTASIYRKLLAALPAAEPYDAPVPA